ncbi:hypothetical protein SynBIOSE41_02682 [Synechococcus sp. BIOS-E4-1]|nr:hypothetical protein SynBIOSE41_02682 [Synechococcus sp. BIOS-E4-1]
MSQLRAQISLVLLTRLSFSDHQRNTRTAHRGGETGAADAAR